MLKKVLLAAPTSRAKDYCFNDWSKNVNKLTYSNLQVILVDNTNDNGEYARTVLSKKFKTVHINPKPGENSFSYITNCQNYIRHYALKNNFDFVFMLETDQFPPMNIIEHLLSFKKKVISCQYFIYQGFASRLLQFETEDFGRFRMSKCSNLDKSFIEWNGDLTSSKYQTGLGCILIHISVLKKINFRTETQNPESNHSDVYFHNDLMINNIPVYVTEKYIIEHRNSTWFGKL
jgi:hypothetical protein